MNFQSGILFYIWRNTSCLFVSWLPITMTVYNKVSYNNFESHTFSAFTTWRDNSEFSDVILASDDGKKFKAHKLVLTASSPVFKEMLTDTTNNIPIVYLRGIGGKILNLMLDFVYKGEVDLPETDIEEFLNFTGEIKINGMSREDIAIDDYDKSTTTDKSLEDNTEQLHETDEYDLRPDMDKHEDDIGDILKDKKENYESNSYVSQEPLIKDFKIEPGQVLVPASISPDSYLKDGEHYICKSCDFRSIHSTSIKRHIKSDHQGINFACLDCDHKSKTSYALKVHQQSKHEGVRYECDVCDYTASKPFTLNNHKKTVHEGLRFACEKCSYEVSSTQMMKNHIQSKHERKKQQDLVFSVTLHLGLIP